MRAVLEKTLRQHLKLFVPKRFKSNLLDISIIFFVTVFDIIPLWQHEMRAVLGKTLKDII